MCAHSREGGYDFHSHGSDLSFGDTNTPGNHTLSSSAPASLQRYKAAIEAASRYTGIDANLIAAQIWAESRGNPKEFSKNWQDGNSDVGLLQISQSTFNGLKTGLHLDVNNPTQNILAGALELKTYLNKFHGNVSAALERYVGLDNPQKNHNYVINVLGFYNDLRNGKGLRDQDYAPM